MERDKAKPFPSFGMASIDKLFELMRDKDWTAAHAMLDEIETADPDTHGLARWRSVALSHEGRYEDALQYLAENQHQFNCKTNVFHKRARILHITRNDAAALDEIARAPFDSEIENHWALVVDAKFFRLYLMMQAGLPITGAEWAEIPDDYISLMPSDERISKEKLIELSARR